MDILRVVGLVVLAGLAVVWLVSVLFGRVGKALEAVNYDEDYL